MRRVYRIDGRRVCLVDVRTFDQKHASMLWLVYVISIRPTEFREVRRG